MNRTLYDDAHHRGLDEAEIPPARRHGLDPETLEGYQKIALRFLYFSLSEPPISATAPDSSDSDDGGDSEGVDGIGMLPDDLLLEVISRLPARDRARTTALSKRWRSLWLSEPLVLVDTHLLPGGDAAEGRRPPRDGPISRAVMSAVSTALEAHPGPVPFVSLTFSFMNQDRRGVIDRWVHLLATKGVHELVLVNRPRLLIRFPLPVELFVSCSSLRRLSLGSWCLPDTSSLPPGATTFPKLQELVLGCTIMMAADFDFMLAASPKLEILTLIGSITRPARLASRSLRCAQFCMSVVEEIAVVNAPRLERLLVWLIRTEIRIGHAPHLRVLGYLEPGMHALDNGDTAIQVGTKPSPTTTVPSVQVLALAVPFKLAFPVNMMSSFLRCFPNVETLHVQSKKYRLITIGDVDLNFWNETGAIECIWSRLRTMIFHGFRGDDGEFPFLMFIAENARVLETMVILIRDELREELSDKTTALCSARWASGESKARFVTSRLAGYGIAWSVKAAADFSSDDPFLCL